MPLKVSTRSWKGGSRRGRGNDVISFRKSPFRRDEDPKLLMIEEVARQGDRVGKPLTDAEKELLASSGQGMDTETDLRLRELIRGILKCEAETREWERDPRCFSASIEWAGDQEYPYVVQLAEEVGKSLQSELPASQPSGKDLASLALTVLGLAMLVVVAIFIMDLVRS